MSRLDYIGCIEAGFTEAPEFGPPRGGANRGRKNSPKEATLRSLLHVCSFPRRGRTEQLLDAFLAVAHQPVKGKPWQQKRQDLAEKSIGFDNMVRDLFCFEQRESYVSLNSASS